MKIWLDFSNSPHPLLFAPIARRLEELGHEVGVTARDNAQTSELTLARWPQATIIGGQSPKARAGKARAMARRIWMLRAWAASFGAEVAVSHNSYGQLVAARTLGIPAVTAMDYEGQPANHLAFRLADVILMPDALRGSGVRRQGAKDARARFYDGFKEEIYLGDFEPDAGVVNSAGGALEGRQLVVARTPPSRAVYHQFDNALFGEAIDALGGASNACVFVLTRHPEQRQAVKALGYENLIVPEHALDSRSLMYGADLVVGAGGTMTREAALMGVPTYSVFAGEQPAVDRELENRGLLKSLVSAGELLPVVERATAPRPVSVLRESAVSLVETFVEAILQARERDGSRRPLSP